MKAMFWLVVLGSAAVGAFIVRYILRRHSQRERAAEARAAEFLAQMAGAKAAASAPAPIATEARRTAPVPARVASALETQKLLFDAARKAGDAGEPALAIELYGRLLARFPDSAFASEVRAAVQAQEKKLTGT